MHTNCFALVIKLLAFSVLQFIITEVFNLRKIICNFMPERFITCKDMAFDSDFRIGIQRSQCKPVHVRKPGKFRDHVGTTDATE